MFDEAFVLEREGEVEKFGVGSDGVEEGEEGKVLKSPVVAGEAELRERYSTHSRWLKFLVMIWRQVFCMELEEMLMRVIFLMARRV